MLSHPVVADLTSSVLHWGLVVLHPLADMGTSFEWKHETRLGSCAMHGSLNPQGHTRHLGSKRKKQRKQENIFFCMILVRPGKLVTKFTIDGSGESCQKLLIDNKPSRLDIWQMILTLLIIITSLNPVPNAQVCVYLTVHITKLQLQTTFPKPLYIPHSAQYPCR